MTNKSLIIGSGEIGKALFNILKPHYVTFIRDRIGNKTSAERNIDIIHICFPYSDEFIKDVKDYQEQYQPRYTIIHSTVPVGTSRKCDAIHSPIRGMHPNLEDDIQHFVKFLGGEQASQVADYFRRANIKIQLCEKSETTELAKILSTTRYGIDIEFCKEVDELCKNNNVPFSEVYTLFTQTYNQGYSDKGYPEYCRSILQPIQTKIGGHCVCPNLELLKSKFTNFLKNI